ncbi:hypothetical protein [Bacillus alkalicellulosilyticus]|uniref:hypothetical protein n=1 Tax=Alkalihalobacterium alkalicellulosilyticum TaxID=1912214 RepID=UPI000995E738|nr:hypothetical protein [Bacillus alkalicellulosilyticus]
MNKLIHFFRFDIKLLGYMYIIPFSTYLLCVFIMLYMSMKSESPYMVYVALQGIAVPIAGCHLILLYSNVFEIPAEETLVYYYRKVLLYDIIRYGVLHFIFILLLVGITLWLNGISFLTPILIIHLIMLFIFYQIFGLAILCFTRNLDITVALLATYTFIEVITQGTFMPWPHVFFFEEPNSLVLITLTFLSLIIGIICSVVLLWKRFK